MQKKIFKVAVVAAIAVVGFYGFRYFTKDDKAAAGKPAQEVSVMTIALTNIEGKQSLPGRVNPFRQSEVRPQVDGVITERMFEEGASVEKGQQLYKIDDARYKANLNSAVADLESARAEVNSAQAKASRYAELVTINAVSKQEYDDAKAEANKARAAVAVAQAAVDLAKVNLDYTKVYAPISGQIGRSFVTEGALVTANQSQSLSIITQLDPIYVDMQQSSTGTEITDFRRRMHENNSIPVSLIFDSKAGETSYDKEGSLKFSEVTVDETSASIALRAQFPNPDGVLLPGMFVRTVLDLGTSQALLVPQRATTRTADGQLKVMTVDGEGKAHQKSITANQAYQDSWIVTGGLNAGEQVVVEGYQKIQEGAAVKAVPVAAPQTAQAKE